MIIPTYEEMLAVNTLSKEIEKKIDIILAGDGDFDKVVEIVKQKETQEIITRNQRIYLIYLISEIVLEEKAQNSSRTLFDNRSVDEAIGVFRKLTLFLRRIEFDFPVEQQKEIIYYILQEKISVTAVLGIIKLNKTIVHKDKVINGFINILGKGQ